MKLKSISEQLLEIVPSDKELLFVCVGTDRATGDCFGPLIGTKLMEMYPEIPVYGSMETPVTAVDLHRTINLILTRFPNRFVIGIDAALGNFDDVGNVKVHNKPLNPGSGVGKKLPEIGDASITGVVNVGGFMEHHVIANTRLHKVMTMADEAVNGISEFLSVRSGLLEVAVGDV